MFRVGRNWSLKISDRKPAWSTHACNDARMSTRTGGADELQANASITQAAGSSARRLLVISHPAVLSVNQEVYRELSRRGWEVTIVLPSRWRHDYSPEDIIPQPLPGLESALRPVPVLLPGRPQRHIYLVRCRALCARLRPDVAFIEEEPFSLPAAQWGRALAGLGIPFGVQCYENIDRALPAPVRHLRSRVLRDAAFVAARSETAATLVRSWGASGEVAIAPPAVPGQIGADVAPTAPAEAGRPFTVGYAGRLIEEKGLLDMLAAVRRLPGPVRMILIGNGALRPALEGQPIPGGSVEVIDDISHEQMGSAYSRLDVLVLASRSTPTWKEQFGRVIVESLFSGVPVVGSDSGEIPWLLALTEGGLLFAEGDVTQLTERLNRLRESPELRLSLGRQGREAVERLFTVPAATDPLERMLSAAAETRTDRRSGRPFAPS